MDSDKTDRLLSFLAETSEKHLRVEEDLGEGFVKLNIDEAQKRQAKHDIRCVEDIVVELLRNSRDADAKNILVASWKNKIGVRKIVIIDDGLGIPTHIQNRIFEARVTSKLDKFKVDEYGVHGRGMALFSIAQNAKCNVIASEKKRGTIFRVDADTNQLSETADQSTNPTVKESGGESQVLGPNNILKTILMFNIRHPELNVFFGSPSQITAKLVNLGSRFFSSKDPFLSPEISYINCMSFIKDASELATCAIDNFGLEISDRNCHRILNSEILAPGLILETFTSTSSPTVRKQSGRSLAGYLNNGDMVQLSNGVANIFNNIGCKYFVKLAEQPQVKREGNSIKLILLLEKVEEI